MSLDAKPPPVRTVSEGKHHPAEFPPGTCTNTAPPTTTTPLPFSGSSRTSHPYRGNQRKANPPLVLSPGGTLHRQSLAAAPAPRRPFVCRAARTFPRDRHGHGCNKRSHRPALCPGPRSPPARHPHLSGRTSCGQRRGGAGPPPSFPPSSRPPGPARGERREKRRGH